MEDVFDVGGLGEDGDDHFLRTVLAIGGVSSLLLDGECGIDSVRGLALM